MIKKALKGILILFMILGIAFSISNIIPKTTNAAMKEELLHFFDLGEHGYAFWCDGEGQGCYTVTP